MSAQDETPSERLAREAAARLEESRRQLAESERAFRERRLQAHTQILSGVSVEVREKPKRGENLAKLVREKTNNNEDQADFFHRLAAGEIPGATLRDQIEAHKWLADRGSGKAPELVSIEKDDTAEDPMKSLTREDLIALTKLKQ